MANKDGFVNDFIGTGKLAVAFPTLGTIIKNDLLAIPGSSDGELKYPHFSICMNAKRRFCFFSAVNINGEKFKSITRKSLFPPSGTDKWVQDSNAGKLGQWGQVLYSAPKSDFDRGHMTRREDPQWGTTDTVAKSGALGTFHFTNAVPQHKDLNQKVWGGLEDYILHTEAELNNLKVNVLTGPVLSADDPFFVTLVSQTKVQLPILFWKIVYYTNDGKNLSRAAFMMGHRDLLIKNKIVTTTRSRALVRMKAPEFFQDYEDKDIFQVNVSTVEKLTGLSFQTAKDPYTDKRPLKLILEEVQARGFTRVKSPLEVSFNNIKLN